MLIKSICVMPHCKHFAVFRLILIKQRSGPKSTRQNSPKENAKHCGQRKGNSAQMQNRE